MSATGRIYARAYDWLAAREERNGSGDARRQVTAHATGTVLEVGAGTGRCLTHYRNVDRVIALEPDPDMRHLATRRAVAAAVPVEVTDGDARHLDFADDTFDSVIVCWVLCTIPQPDQALREIRRVLRPNGLLYYCEHVRATDPRLAARQDRWAPVWRVIGRGCRCNQDTLTLIRENGFDTIRTTLTDLPTGPAILRPNVLGHARPISELRRPTAR